MKFADLKFEPLDWFRDMEQALHGDFAVIRCPFNDGYDVVTLDGAVVTDLTEEQVEELIS